MLRLKTFNPAIIDIYCCHQHENVDAKQSISMSDNELIILTKPQDAVVNITRDFILDIMTGLLAVHSMGYVLPTKTWSCASSGGKGILINLQDAVQISPYCYLGQNNGGNPSAIRFDIQTLVEKLSSVSDEVVELLRSVTTDTELYSLIIEYRNLAVKDKLENMRIVPTFVPGKRITMEHRENGKSILEGCTGKESEIVFALSIDILYRCPEEFLSEPNLLQSIYFLAKNWYYQSVISTSTFWMKIIVKFDGLLYRPYIWENCALFSLEERQASLVCIFDKNLEYPSIDLSALRKNRPFLIPTAKLL